MLKGLDPLLTADLLHHLRSAGHGDQIAIVDCNFPAATTATKTTMKTHVVLAGADAVQTLDAVCSVLPIDFFVDCPCFFMAPSPGLELPPLGQEVHEKGKESIVKHAPGVGINPIERFEFYEAASKCFVVIQAAAERRPYGNFILTKGVVGPDGNDLKP